MQLLSIFNKGILLLMSAIDIFRKYAWVVPLKDLFLNESGLKPNKILVDKGSEF